MIEAYFRARLNAPILDKTFGVFRCAFFECGATLMSVTGNVAQDIMRASGGYDRGMQATLIKF